MSLLDLFLDRVWRGIAVFVLVAVGLAAPVAHAAERSIDKDVIIKATPAQAWQSWTTREGITSFFAPDAEIDARVGGAFHIFIDPYGAPGEKGADEMRYLALQPEKMLSFDWNAPPSLPEARKQRTLVVVRFEPVDAEHTKVSVHQVGWGDGGEWDKTFAYFSAAWPHVLANLQKRWETGQPIDWTEWNAQLKQMHEKQTAAARAAAASAAH